jgi:hypothetical protein
MTVLIFCLCKEAYADVSLPPIPNRAPASYYIDRADPVGIDLEKLADLEKQVRGRDEIKTEDFIPLNLPETSHDGRLIAGKVLRHSLQTWVDSAERDHSLLHKNAKTANRHLNTSVALFPTSSNHKFQMKFKAIQGLAVLRYQGFFSANYSYYSLERTSNLEVTQSWAGKTYYVDRSENYLGYTSMAGVRWAF